MNSLSRNFFDRKIDFDKTRVRPFGAMVSTEDKVEVSRFGRIYRFLTFHKDSNLTAVNRGLVEGLKSGVLIKEIAHDLLVTHNYFPEVKKNGKENVLANIKSLNEKFISGNQHNFLSRMVLKVINAVRFVFRMDFIGYHVLDTMDIEKRLNDELVRRVSRFEAAMVSAPPLPPFMSPFLLTGAPSSSGAPLNVGDAVKALPLSQQVAVRRLFDTGELLLPDFTLLISGPQGTTNVNFETSGNVAVQLPTDLLASLQNAIAGNVDDASRLTACLLLVGAGSHAGALLEAVERNEINSGDSAVKLLETARKNDSTPARTLLDRVSDSKNPLEIIIGDSRCTIHLETDKTGKSYFHIGNVKGKSIEITTGGVFYGDEKFGKAIGKRSEDVRYLVSEEKKSLATNEILSIKVQADVRYTLKSGDSFLNVSCPDFKKSV